MNRFILQGLNREDDHISALEHVFSLSPIEKGIIATAFMNSVGATLLVSILENNVDRFDIFVGIRNGITSKQALDILMRHGFSPYIVDTASQAYIFHPKVYLASNFTTARLIVGSANATTGGLARNVEASLCSDISMETGSELINSVYNDFEELKRDYPDNIFRISLADLDRFVENGLLVDETHTYRTGATRAHNVNREEARPIMRLRTRRLPRALRTAHTPERREPVADTALVITTVTNQNLLWRSGRLNRRDLNIPTGTNTNRTGSMLFKRGDPSQNIDQRVYFRQEVFANQNWEFDRNPRYNYMERCFCNFRFVIKGIDYGVYTLKLSHNTRTDTATYAQRNSMTQIHWGDALPLIAREDLLDSICCLYAPEDDGVFTLVFDNE